jgi:WD40-like Beta Propeller Repeat
MAKTNHWGTLAVAAGTLVAVALLVLMLVVVNPQTAGAALPGQNGNIAYSSTRTGVYEIYTIDPTLGGCCGKRLTHNTQPGNTFAHGAPCYSPDGNTIGYSRQYAAGDDNDIYTIPATGGTPTQITFNSAEEYGCSFTGPRGSHIVQPSQPILQVPAQAGVRRSRAWHLLSRPPSHLRYPVALARHASKARSGASRTRQHCHDPGYLLALPA